MKLLYMFHVPLQVPSSRRTAWVDGWPHSAFARFSSAHCCSFNIIYPLARAATATGGRRMRRVESTKDVFEARALNLQNKNSTVCGCRWWRIEGEECYRELEGG